MKKLLLGIGAALALAVFILWAANRVDVPVEGLGRSAADAKGDSEGAAAPTGLDAPGQQPSEQKLPSRESVADRGEAVGLGAATEPARLRVLVVGRRSGVAVVGATVRRPPEGARRFVGREITGSDGLATIDAKAYSRLTIRAAGYATGKFEVPARQASVAGSDGDEQEPPHVVVLNEHAELFGRVEGWDGTESEQAFVAISHMVGGAEKVTELRVPVRTSGTWRAPRVEIAHGEAFAEGLMVSLVQGASKRVLAHGLMLRPGDRREVHDLAGSERPWTLSVTYSDGSPLQGGAKIRVQSHGRQDGDPDWSSNLDGDGQVRVRGVAAGTYLARVTQGKREFAGELMKAPNSDEEILVLHGYGRVAGVIRSNSDRVSGESLVRLIGLDEATLGTQRAVEGSFRFDLVPLGTPCQLIIPVAMAPRFDSSVGGPDALGDPLLRELRPLEKDRLFTIDSSPFVKDVRPSLEDFELQIDLPE